MKTNNIGLISVEDGQEAHTEEGTLLGVHGTPLADGPLTPW